ncbi:MAG: tripartite tricarboxylate transporter substrate binding protein [Proteobacteria bacterium]|nr:tripartite tricarboxylate transporter substrate binding protein [Pseudomonadota bacterium]
MPVRAQETKIIVPMAAGGPADFVARTFSEKLREKTGSVVIVENRTGANGVIGAQYVSGSAPDGQTLLFATSGLLTITPTLDPNNPYNPAKELRPITTLVVNGTALIVRKDHPANSIADLVKMAKDGKTITLGSAGNGNILHLYVELLKDVTKINIQHVPYRGVAPAMTDALGGTIDGLFADLPAALPQIHSGKMKALGLVGETRNKAAPDIPTIAEQGYPGVMGASWFGLFGPATMSPDVAAAVAKQAGAILRDPELSKRFEVVGAVPTPVTPTEFAARIEKDRANWAKVIAKNNIKLDN